LASALLLATTGAYAQSGSNNGNGNIGSGNGNGNGNGNNNGSNNILASSGGTSNVNFRSRRNAPSVIAPGLAAAGIESCLGSASIGGSGPGFGLTIASTTTDKGCNLRLFSRTLYSLGHRRAATQILCNDAQVAEALGVEVLLRRPCRAAGACRDFGPWRDVPAGLRTRTGRGGRDMPAV
jgi:hypothetical protein